jgi:hypothetical protein
MSTIVATDAYGNIVAFQADARPIEADASKTAFKALIVGASATSINSGSDLSVGGNLSVTGTTALTGAATLTGAISAASAAITGAVTAASAAISGAVTAVTTIVTSGLATVQSLKLDTGTKTATATAGAATLNKSAGIVTSEALSTAAGSSYTLTLTNSTVAAGDLALVSIDSNGTAGTPQLLSAKCTSNTLTVIVKNVDASVALNAAIKIGFAILKA